MAKVLAFEASNASQAEELRATLGNYLQAGETIELHFALAGIVSGSLLNIALASLLMDFSSEALNRQLVFYGMSQQHKYALAQAINAQKEMLADG